jgi:hypothetical protein
VDVVVRHMANILALSTEHVMVFRRLAKSRPRWTDSAPRRRGAGRLDSEH